MKLRTAFAAAAILATLGVASEPAWTASETQAGQQGNAAAQQKFLAPGLTVPAMDPERGKKLFAGKGCVVCHSINGIGGTDAPKLDASTMPMPMNPFEFFAKMWRGAEPMIAMQRDEIGHQIEFTGQDLADIVAFVHNPAVQKTFTKDDIPPETIEHMEEDEADHDGHHGTMNRSEMGHGSGMKQDMMQGKDMMETKPKQ